jgi:hypothetical protein
MMARKPKDPESRRWEGERRKRQRNGPAAIPHLKSARVIAGSEARVVNISSRGALLETETSLAPGRQVVLRFVTADATMNLQARVVYSRTAALNGPAIRFHSAVEFEQDFPLVDTRLEGEVVPLIMVPNAPDDLEAPASVESDLNSHPASTVD